MSDQYRDSEARDKVQQIEAEVARLTSLVNRLVSGGGIRVETPGPTLEARYPAAYREGPVSPISFGRARARMVRQLIQHRRKRERQFDVQLLADPGWDMLLDLYAAHYEEQAVSVSSLCIAAAVPATTALRWIKTMEEEGHFVRTADPDDRRRIFIQLSEAARAKLDDYFDDIGS